MKYMIQWDTINLYLYNLNYINIQYNHQVNIAKFSLSKYKIHFLNCVFAFPVLLQNKIFYKWFSSELKKNFAGLTFRINILFKLLLHMLSIIFLKDWFQFCPFKQIKYV